MYTLTAADFADTGQWRLLIDLWESGLQAWLENTLHKEIPLQKLCKVSWSSGKNRYKENLEKAVYENPRLLDDFAIRILTHDRCTMFIPDEFLDKSDAEGDFYSMVYDSDPEDVMYEHDGLLTAAWNPGPGVRNFLLRTFPGARISNHLMELFKRLKESNKGKCLYIREGEDWIDFLLMSDKNLVSASTRAISSEEEIQTLTEEIIKAYGFREEEVKIDREEATR